LPGEYAILTGETVSPLLVLLVLSVGATLVPALEFVAGPAKGSKQKDPEIEA